MYVPGLFPGDGDAKYTCTYLVRFLVMGTQRIRVLKIWLMPSIHVLKIWPMASFGGKV